MLMLTNLSISQMASGLRSGDFSAVELVSAHLERIHKTNESLNSFIKICDDMALSQAKDADDLLKRDPNKANILTGIPVAIKDQIVTKGIETTCGSRMLTNFIPPFDSTVVKKLKASGAVIIGKTNQDEFAMGSSSESSAFGSVKNPWDTSRVAGGSSGGSAVAVAVGQAPLSLGTDTGGSIRQPASFSGVVGLKPTYGRVSRYGAVAYASSLDQIGPIGRSVRDVAIGLSCIAGKDDRDSTSMDISVPDFATALDTIAASGLKGTRIGVPRECFSAELNTEVREATENSIRVLKELGAQIVDISLPYSKYAIAAYYIIAPAEASSNLARYDGVRYGHRAKKVTSLTELYEMSRSEGFGMEVKRRILMGTYVLSAGYFDAYYKKAQQVRTLIINDFKSAFDHCCDFIVMPVSPFTAFKLGEKLDDPLQMYLADVFTLPLNLAGLPGISVPCAKDSNKLPIGLQIIGKPFEEAALLQVAHAFEQVAKFDTSIIL